jgi:hypothetical protein
LYILYSKVIITIKSRLIRYFYVLNITYLHTLYAQFKRIMLVAHVLPRLLAHDWPQLRLMVWSLFNHTLQLYNYHNLHITYTKLPDRALTHCPGFLTAARSRVLCIPQVADSSLNSATDGWLILQTSLLCQCNILVLL